MATPYETKCQILAELWLNYRADEDFTDFIEYNDLGLPLAYAINAEIVASTPAAAGMIEETFALLLAGLDIEEDAGYDSIDELLDLE